MSARSSAEAAGICLVMLKSWVRLADVQRDIEASGARVFNVALDIRIAQASDGASPQPKKPSDRRVAHVATRRMAKRQSGIGAALGVAPQKNQAHYAAAKASVIQLTRVMALELESANIRVNRTAPGYFKTEGRSTGEAAF